MRQMLRPTLEHNCSDSAPEGGLGLCCAVLNASERRLRTCGPSVEKLGNGSDKLRWRERLLQHDAVGHSRCRALCAARPADVDDRNFSTDHSGVAGNFPTIDP